MRKRGSPSVIFVAPSAYTLSGLATWLDYLIPALVQRGWKANLALVSGRQHHRPEPYLLAHPALDPLIAHCETDTPVGRRLALENLLTKAKPDVAVSVNIPDLYVAINRLRGRVSSQTRTVMSVHGIENYLYADLLRYSSVMDAVICSNRLACALCNALAGFTAERVFYAPYGINSIGLKHANPICDRLRIVYSGRLETPQKRCMDLVGIAKYLRASSVPFQLKVVGDGPDRAMLETALSDFIADGSVALIGYVDSSELRARIYPEAHAIIITSSWETGPIVAWEAMAQGVCVVSSRYIGSGREAALENERNSLLFEIGDTQAAAAALARIWTSPELRTRLCQGGADLINQRFNTRASVGAWESALETVLERQPVPTTVLPAPRPHGRLDKWLGVELAHRLRAAFHLRPPLANDPGGEWPHAHNHALSDDAFWRLAREQDVGADHNLPVQQHVA